MSCVRVYLPPRRPSFDISSRLQQSGLAQESFRDCAKPRHLTAPNLCRVTNKVAILHPSSRDIKIPSKSRSFHPFPYILPSLFPTSPTDTSTAPARSRFLHNGEVWEKALFG